MFPYIESHTWSLGPLTFQTWGTLVATGFIVGTWIAAQRAKKNGLNPKLVWDMAFWIFLAAMIGSRVFHVVFYDPMYYLAHPLDALDPRRPGFAIEGGFFASAGVFWYFIQKHKLNFYAYADTLMWGLPWGCGIGRIGCFLIHDHPGTLSNFVLAVKYPDGKIRHDLGLYLSLVGFSIGLIFLAIDRLVPKEKRSPLLFLGAFMILDSISRLGLDFLRTVDVRYFGLTPTQWFAFPLIGIGIWLLCYKKVSLFAKEGVEGVRKS